ncbi:hypothetical protein AVEN_105593-1, partial [Araneus ventricosus]
GPKRTAVSCHPPCPQIIQNAYKGKEKTYQNVVSKENSRLLRRDGVRRLSDIILMELRGQLMENMFEL